MKKKANKDAGAEKAPAKNQIENTDKQEAATQSGAIQPKPIAFAFGDKGVAILAEQELGPDDQSELTEQEQDDFAKAESVIEKGLATFKEVGAKLREIHDNKWYREKYRTFEKYCLSRWDISRSHAYRLMEASEVAAKMSPKGDKSSPNYAQATALAEVPEEKRQEVLDEATREAGDKAPSGKQVKQTAAKMKAKNSTASKLKVVEPEEQDAEDQVEDADREEDQDDDQEDPAEEDDQEQARPRPKVSLVKILELLGELSYEVERLEDSCEACVQLRQIRTFLQQHCPQAELEEAA